MCDLPWTLEAQRVHLALGPLHALLDLQDPAGGLQELHLQHAPLHANLLGVLFRPQAETTPTDAYVRGEDLVATYPQTGGRAMRVQVYWRCESSPARLAIDLQVSVQTDLLGITTPVVASSQLEAVQIWRLIDPRTANYVPLPLAPNNTDLCPMDGPGCLLLHLPASDWCYAEMIHPADFQQDRLVLTESPRGPRRATWEHRLFPETLEKGVLLRARIRGLFLPQSTAAAALAADYLQFLASPPPLTT